MQKLVFCQTGYGKEPVCRGIHAEAARVGVDWLLEKQGVVRKELVL